MLVLSGEKIYKCIEKSVLKDPLQPYNLDGRFFVRYLERENMFCQSCFINKLMSPLKILKSNEKSFGSLRSVDLHQRAFKNKELFQSFFLEPSFKSNSNCTQSSVKSI